MEKSTLKDRASSLKNASKVTQSRALMLEFYPPQADGGGVCPATVYAWALSVPAITRFWCNLHDKDLKSDGTPAEPHYHFVCHMEYEKTEQAVAKWLVKTFCPCVKPVNPNGVLKFSLWSDIRDAVRYLRHLDTPRKYQYPDIKRLLSNERNGSDSLPKYEEWCTTSPRRTLSHGNPDDDFNTLSAISLLDLIQEKGIDSMSMLFRYLIDAPDLMRWVMEHQYLSRTFVQENCRRVTPTVTVPFKDKDIAHFFAAFHRVEDKPNCRLPDGRVVTYEQAVLFFDTCPTNGTRK